MMEEEFLPILKVESERINSKVLVCGDPKRAAKIGDKLNQSEEVSYNREYRLINGERNGEHVSVVSHGVGGSGAAACFEELVRGGAREMIRVGTAGSLSREVQDGDLVIASGAIREDGMSQQMIKQSYPAIANHGLVQRLENAANRKGPGSKTGIVLTSGLFYPELEERPSDYFQNTPAIAVEMEASVLFLIASLNEIKAGAVMTIDGFAVDFDAEQYDPHRDVVDQGIDRGIEVAIEAIVSDA